MEVLSIKSEKYGVVTVGDNISYTDTTVEKHSVITEIGWSVRNGTGMMMLSPVYYVVYLTDLGDMVSEENVVSITKKALKNPYNSISIPAIEKNIKMAQGPKELISSFLNEVDAFEYIIDNALIGKRVSEGGSVEIRTPDGGLTDQHLKELRVRYINAGWSDLVKNDRWVGTKENGKLEKYLVFKTKA